jgi:hypothetical protein
MSKKKSLDDYDYEDIDEEVLFMEDEEVLFMEDEEEELDFDY